MYLPMRERNVQIITQIAQAWIGMKLYLAANTGVATMSPTVYGRWAYDTPADLWSALFVTTSLFYCTFIYINGRWRHSPLMRVFACLVLVVAHLSMGISAYWDMLSPVTASEFVGSPIAEYSTWYFPPIYIYFLWVNWHDYMRRLK